MRRHAGIITAQMPAQAAPRNDCCGAALQPFTACPHPRYSAGRIGASRPFRPFPVTTMRPTTILLSIALLCASGQLLATESRQMDQDAGSTCPENTVAGTDATDELDADAAAAPARRTQKAKPAPTPRASNGGGSNRSSTPRWHSFLPGMFR